MNQFVITTRGLIATGLTTVGLVLLLSFKTPADLMLPVGTAPPMVAPGSPQASQPSGQATPSTQPSTSSPSGSGQPTPAATPVPPPAPTVVTVAGPAIPAQKGNALYGYVQVQVTLVDGQLVDVTNLILPSGSGKTDGFSACAGPALQAEALAAQSAQIDTVCGATYTSDAYRQSLQSALDQARA